MSELTKQIREEYPNVIALCDEHERLEAEVQRLHAEKAEALTDRVKAFNDAVERAVSGHDALSAEHARVCNEYALLVQESGREGRELDRLEGLLRAWGLEFDIRRRDAVYAEAVRLAREAANG